MKNSQDPRSTPEDDLALEAKQGNTQAFSKLWELSVPRISRIAAKVCKRYPWIASEDVAGEVHLQFPKLFKRWKPERGTKWSKFAGISVYRAVQDVLRKEDPLGIKLPIKSRYPEWRRLGDLRKDFRDGFRQTSCVDGLLSDGIDRIDRGYEFTPGDEESPR